MSKLVKKYVADMVKSAKSIIAEMERTESRREELQRELESIIEGIAMYL